MWSKVSKVNNSYITNCISVDWDCENMIINIIEAEESVFLY